MLVDWETLVIYTCTNKNCIPEFDKEEFYREDFGYIQFSNDFANVKYGDDKQIQEQKKRKQQQAETIPELSKEEEAEIIKEQEELKREHEIEQQKEAEKDAKK